MKYKDTVLNETNIVGKFEEQKCSLDSAFKEIEFSHSNII